MHQKLKHSGRMEKYRKYDGIQAHKLASSTAIGYSQKLSYEFKVQITSDIGIENRVKFRYNNTVLGRSNFLTNLGLNNL